MSIWAWLLGTRVGRWLAVTGAVIAAIVSAWAAGWLKGKRTQADADKAHEAQSLADAMQDAVDAANAADKVKRDAQAQPPPNPVKRDDFDNSF